MDILAGVDDDHQFQGQIRCLLPGWLLPPRLSSEQESLHVGQTHSHHSQHHCWSTVGGSSKFTLYHVNSIVATRCKGCVLTYQL